MRKEKEHIKGNWTSLLSIVEDRLEKNHRTWGEARSGYQKVFHEHD